MSRDTEDGWYTYSLLPVIASAVGLGCFFKWVGWRFHVPGNVVVAVVSVDTRRLFLWQDTPRFEYMTLVDAFRDDTPSRKKLEGIHYTPDRLAHFVASRLLHHATLPTQRSVRVLDPACGDGALLVALAKILHSKGIAAKFTGGDIDMNAVITTERRLSEVYAGVEFRGIQGDFTALASRRTSGNSPTLFEAEQYDSPAKYDLIIANPPYVRTQHLGSKRAQELSRRFGLKGRVDLYQVFTAGFVDALDDGGAFGLIVPNRFMFTRGGASMRNLLSQNFQLDEIFDLGDTKIFAAAVLPALVFGSKTGRTSSRVAVSSIYSTSSNSTAVRANSIFELISNSRSGDYVVNGDGWRVSKGEIDLNDRTDFTAPWLAVGGANDIVDRVDRNAAGRFSDLGVIKVGVKTTADSVFIRGDWSVVPKATRPEEDLVFPLVSADTARRWSCLQPNKSILYPYDMTKHNRQTLDLASRPRTRAYLESHREVLAGRKYVVESGREWWEIWVPQKPAAWAGTKIVFPDISVEGQFAIDRSGALVNGNCYWIPVKPESIDLAYLAIAVANSSLILKYYDARFGNKLYAGRRRFISQYVREFPLPDVTGIHARRAVQLARLLESEGDASVALELEREADSSIWQAFGIEKT